MSNIREGIRTFLSKRKDESPYLIPKWNVNLESQYLVHPGSVAVEGNADAWTDGTEEWSHHRWPRNAGTNPNYRDRTLKFSPGAHLKRMGSTWWNFKTKRSVAVALDIDLEGEHAESTTTVTPAKLADLTRRLCTLDYLTLVRSSGGQGVHIYCFFDEKHQPESANHNEHAQVAHALVAKISKDLNYNLKQHMDAVGVIFWFWSCDSPSDHPGYELIQEQTRSLKASDLDEFMGIKLADPNRRIKVEGYTDTGERVSNTEEGGGYKTYPLEPWHSEFLKRLEDMGYSFIWQSEFNMAHTHTCAIKELCDQLKAEGKPVKGLFNTISRGSDKTKPNCYITPRPGGAFQVKRFGTGTAEHPLWSSRDGDTWCYLNQETPVLQVLKRFCSSYDGLKMTFTADALEESMQALGKTLGDSMKLITAPIHVVLHKDGTLHAQFKSDGHYEGWNQRGDKLTRDLPVIHKRSDFNASMLDEADRFVRHVVTPDFEPFGWALKTKESWMMFKSFDPVSCVVSQIFGKDAGQLRAEMTQNPWVLTHLPFGKEYPGGRLWNKHAPQLAIEPAKAAGSHPHWDKVMDHLGRSLDDTVSTTSWCQQWGIHTGADYLRYWISAMIQDPMEPLPYLFFYGPQDSGKSIFHESISILFTGGVVSVATALSSSAGYNFEVANAVLGYVEEKDLSVNKEAYTRIKEWVMAKTMLIHQKGHTPYQQPNTLHLCQMANKPTSVSMEDGDTRITAILVNALKHIIPKKLLFAKLEEEAPFFLRTLLTIEIPESHTRLRVPMIATQHKHDLEEMHQTVFETFANESLIPCDGCAVKVSDFYEKYRAYCQIRNAEPERKTHVIQLLRNRGDKWEVGVYRNKQIYIANVTFNPNDSPKKRLAVTDSGRMKRV